MQPSHLLKQHSTVAEFRSLVTGILTKRVSIFKEHIHNNLWISNNHNSQETGCLVYPTKYSFVYLLEKWQHSNYSIKINRPQIWLLNFSGCLSPIATTSHLWHFFLLKIMCCNNFHKVNLYTRVTSKSKN